MLRSSATALLSFTPRQPRHLKIARVYSSMVLRLAEASEERDASMPSRGAAAGHI